VLTFREGNVFQGIIWSVIGALFLFFGIMSFVVANETGWTVIYRVVHWGPPGGPHDNNRPVTRIANVRALTDNGARRKVQKMVAPNQALIVGIEREDDRDSDRGVYV
jgi:CRISPR/Cas system type I-B associated protein Csh2 (Cas7 group RAMP superfamily)